MGMFTQQSTNNNYLFIINNMYTDKYYKGSRWQYYFLPI